MKEEAEVRLDDDILNGVALRPSVSSDGGKEKNKIIVKFLFNMNSIFFKGHNSIRSQFFQYDNVLGAIQMYFGAFMVAEGKLVHT